MPRKRNQRIRLNLANTMNLRRAIFVTLVATAAVAISSGFSEIRAEPDTARQGYLANLLKQDCGSCHGLKLKGGLGTPLRPETIRDRSDEVLIETILTGIPGTPMPAWKGLLSNEDVGWIVKLLREGAIKGD